MTCRKVRETDTPTDLLDDIETLGGSYSREKSAWNTDHRAGEHDSLQFFTRL